MAKGEYYIEGRSLFYDSGDGFKNRGNAGSTANQALINQGTKVNDPNSSSSSSGYTPPKSDNVIKFTAPRENKSQALRYPSDLLDDKSDYVIFTFFKYDPPFGRGQGGDGSVNIDSGNSGYDLYAQSGIGKKTTSPPIILYMPEDVQAQYSAKWGGAGFGTLTAGLLNLAGTNLSAIPTGIQSVPGMIKTMAFDQITKSINETLNANVNINQVMGGVSGTVLNPNVEMMYESPDLRGFDLSFKMTPRTDGEAKTIRKICNRFKKSMLPSFGGQAIFGFENNSPNLLTIPDVCQVTFMKGSGLHPFLPQYKLSAITDVSINYTPDGSYATYSDGSPVATQLKITFREMKILFASEINEDGPTF
jgi:hypothetical protein